MKLIKGSAPSEWYFDPQDIRYFHGWGIPEQRLRQILKNMIAGYGIASLQLSDKPELEKEILHFIESD